MTLQKKVRCARCSTLFAVGHDDDETHHLLRCRRCGREKALDCEDVTEFFSDAPFSSFWQTGVPSESGKFTEPVKNGAPANERRYRFTVERLAGLCVCGSVFKFSGKPRCPRCRSSVYRFEPESCTPGQVSPWIFFYVWSQLSNRKLFLPWRIVQANLQITIFLKFSLYNFDTSIYYHEKLLQRPRKLTGEWAIRSKTNAQIT
jgi:DNA-directed RNA polymerase subunit RPC12/RpoP